MGPEEQSQGERLVALRRAQAQVADAEQRALQEAFRGDFGGIPMGVPRKALGAL